MMTNEERIQEVLDALLLLRVGTRVRIVSCDHGIRAGQISELLDCSGLQPWMVGATGRIIKRDPRQGAEFLVKFDYPDFILAQQWWVGAHQVEPLPT